MPATPQDHKRPKASEGPIEFSVDGETYVLPGPDEVTTGMIFDHGEKEDLACAKGILADACDPETFAALRKVPFRQLDGLLSRWFAATLGTDPGNS